MSRSASGNRALFVATILAGSFLLFLIQPMVARMALPRLGGAPAVWNSAMLVYQALLLGGYAYAHRLARLPIRRQATIHIALLLVACVTLPVRLAALPAPAPGWEAVWVPALLAVSIGPVFFLISAQAPLMQRWFAASPDAREPWALYAASNIGSFAGLIAYPLLAEPLLGLASQGWMWSLGYGLLIVLVALAARARWRGVDVLVTSEQHAEKTQKVPERQIALWLALSAVPSGLMLSTTTHLTTDLVAMPLLWVIPLGLYLLSFVPAFAVRRRAVRIVTALAPAMLLLAGGLAMVSKGNGSLVSVLLSVVLLFVVSVALHGRLHDARPEPAQLTLFYFTMSLGGALGGLFTALAAPLLFDWVWEHPLLVLAAAMLLPASPWLDWRRLPGLEPGMVRLGQGVLLLGIGLLGWFLFEATYNVFPGPERWWLTGGIVALSVLLAAWRWLFVTVLIALMLVQGGVETVEASVTGARTRSYFGVYTVHDYPEAKLRVLQHGTTLHGMQSSDPMLRRMPISYYGPGSGAAIAMANAQRLFGAGARIGVVGLGAGTLACFARPGEAWRFYEIDRAVLAFSRNRTFTYVSDCAPQAKVVIGDARLSLAAARPASLDILAIDAFSSDSIPLHLLTDEAFGTYLKALSPRGLLVLHISNRFIELEPVIAAEAQKRGLTALIRDDAPPPSNEYTGSSWVLMARDPAQLKALRGFAPALELRQLQPLAPRAWTDDHASILPYIRWRNLLGKP